MKSGWLLTIFVNSLSQVIVDVLIKMRMGLTDEQILASDMRLIAGGDDTLQTFPETFDVSAYYVKAKELGVVLEEFVVHKSFHGCSFFSTKFMNRGGIWEYYPLRFTKHIAKLKTTKLDDLACALSSHMINYCWDVKRFTFFEKMYMKLRKDNPLLFPLTFLKSRQYLQFKSKGAELAC
jgi:hypothetical protein